MLCLLQSAHDVSLHFLREVGQVLRHEVDQSFVDLVRLLNLHVEAVAHLVVHHQLLLQLRLLRLSAVTFCPHLHRLGLELGELVADLFQRLREGLVAGGAVRVRREGGGDGLRGEGGLDRRGVRLLELGIVWNEHRRH